MFVPDVTTIAGEGAVFRDLEDGQAPRPEHSDIIRSAGAAGLLMRFSRPSMVGVALHALEAPRRPGSPGTGMPAHHAVSADMYIGSFASLDLKCLSLSSYRTITAFQMRKLLC